MLVEPPTLLVCDASFIGLAKLLAAPLALAAPQAPVWWRCSSRSSRSGREHVGKGGIVTDQAAADACSRANSRPGWRRQGWPVKKWTDSPIAGGDGNRERLFFAENYQA